MGMFGYNKSAAPDATGVGNYGLDASVPVASATPSQAQPGFFQSGGMGGNLLMGAAGGALDGVAHWGGLDGGYSTGLKANQKAQLEWQQRIALERFKRDNPEPTALQRNAEYLGSRNPEYRATYERAQANPMTLMTDPSTGALGFYPKGGVAPAAPVNVPAVADEASYAAIPSGAQYRDPQGNVRTKP